MPSVLWLWKIVHHNTKESDIQLISVYYKDLNCTKRFCSRAAQSVVANQQTVVGPLCYNASGEIFIYRSINNIDIKTLEK